MKVQMMKGMKILSLGMGTKVGVKKEEDSGTDDEEKEKCNSAHMKKCTISLPITM